MLRREVNAFNFDSELSTSYPELGKPQNHSPMTQYELVQARRYLQQDVLVLRRVEGISATTVKIVWDVRYEFLNNQFFSKEEGCTIFLTFRS